MSFMRAQCDQLPADVLDANPNIPTFKTTFAGVKKLME
jgi:hypothetical protein